MDRIEPIANMLSKIISGLLVCSWVTALTAAEPPPALPPHPRLLLNADGIAQLKARVTAAPWAKREWDALLKQTSRYLSQPVELPPRGGNWSHNYVCPTHGARLKQGQKIGPWQWEHWCSAGKHNLKGDPSKGSLDFDGNAISGIHFELAKQVVDHGLVFQVTGDARHAQKAREILLAYAGKYLDYPMHNNKGAPGKGGRVASQSLTEASWVIEIVQGADLVWSTLSDGDRTAITRQILRPALEETILKSKLGIHNIQCRLNSAIGLVGFLLGDQTLITRAIDDPTLGYRQQMERGVLADGMWTEGSSGYHFFTVAGVWPLTEAARNCGMDLYGEKFKRMFDAPLTMAMPNFVLPDFNDSGMMSLQGEADLYELGYARYRNPAYAALLSQSKRQSRMALLYGVTELPPASTLTLASRNSPASGYAILQRGQDQDATWLCAKYGPHGGGHGHPDKNHFLLFAHGQVVAPDGGTHAYGSPLHNGWDKSTFAHNTLVVDETSQKAAEGRSLAFGSEQGVDFSMTEAGAIYAGVRFVRTIALLTPEIIVFMDQVRASEPHTYDLVYHQMGHWQGLTAGQPWTPPNRPGYQYLTEATVRNLGPDGLRLQTTIKADWQPVIHIASGEPVEIITGHGILKTTEDQVPLVIQRRKGTEAAFLWAVSLTNQPVTLRSLPLKDGGGAKLAASEAMLVEVSAGRQRWQLLANPEKRTVVMDGPSLPLTTSPFQVWTK